MPFTHLETSHVTSRTTIKLFCTGYSCCNQGGVAYEMFGAPQCRRTVVDDVVHRKLCCKTATTSRKHLAVGHASHTASAVLQTCWRLAWQGVSVSVSGASVGRGAHDVHVAAVPAQWWPRICSHASWSESGWLPSGAVCIETVLGIGWRRQTPQTGEQHR